MPKYTNDTNDIIKIGVCKILYPGDSIETTINYDHITSLTKSTSGDIPYLELKYEEKTISAQDTYTDWFFISSQNNLPPTTVDLSISGTFVATVTLQRKFSVNGDIEDVDTFTEADETYFTVSSNSYYRIGVKTGEYTSGDISIKMKN